MGKFRLILLCMLMLGSCTTSPTYPGHKPTMAQVVNNPASMTKTLKALDNNLSVQMLKTGQQGTKYVRIVALKLSGTPVIAAISQTDMTNTTFKNIIANADVTPIGTKLFASDSTIKRRQNMQIRQIKLSSIKNSVITDYLLNLGYTPGTYLTERSSQFYSQMQTLDLIEYILPAMDKFVGH